MANGMGSCIVGGGTKVFDLGVGKTFNVSTLYPDYAKLTTANFICEQSGTAGDCYGRGTSRGPGAYWARANASLSKSYNPANGVLSAKVGCSMWGDHEAKNSSISGSAEANVHAYLVIGKVKSGA